MPPGGYLENIFALNSLVFKKSASQMRRRPSR
jgi:hypothetical protein